MYAAGSHVPKKVAVKNSFALITATVEEIIKAKRLHLRAIKSSLDAFAEIKRKCSNLNTKILGT